VHIILKGGNVKTSENRRFPRVKVGLKIGYEFVKWNEKKLDKLKKPDYATIYDLSANGIGLFNLKDLTPGILKKLEKGKLKVRLEVFLFKDKDPLISFARLIWSNLNQSEKMHRYGFVFLDVTESFFINVKNFVDDHLKKSLKNRK
jgi:hypothetical protein